MKTFEELDRQLKGILKAKVSNGDFPQGLCYNDVKRIFVTLQPNFKVARKFVENYSPSRSFKGLCRLLSIISKG